MGEQVTAPRGLPAKRLAQNARARGYLFALLAITGYYILQRIGVALGVDGRLPPWLAGQFANLCFGLAGGFSFWSTPGDLRGICPKVLVGFVSEMFQ